MITRPSGSSAAAGTIWWLKTPLPGVVWCNCPHMPGLDGLKVDDLTAAEFEGRAGSTTGRLRPREDAGLRKCLCRRFRAADRRAPDTACSKANTS